MVLNISFYCKDNKLLSLKKTLNYTIFPKNFKSKFLGEGFGPLFSRWREGVEFHSPRSPCQHPPPTTKYHSGYATECKGAKDFFLRRDLNTLYFYVHWSLFCRISLTIYGMYSCLWGQLLISHCSMIQYIYGSVVASTLHGLRELGIPTVFCFIVS